MCKFFVNRTRDWRNGDLSGLTAWTYFYEILVVVSTGHSFLSWKNFSICPIAIGFKQKFLIFLPWNLVFNKPSQRVNTGISVFPRKEARTHDPHTQMVLGDTVGLVIFSCATCISVWTKHGHHQRWCHLQIENYGRACPPRVGHTSRYACRGSMLQSALLQSAG